MGDNKCSDKLDDFLPFGNENLSQDETKILEEVLGDDVCVEDGLERFVSLFFIPLVAFLTFIVLSVKCVDRWFVKEIPRYGYRLFAKAVIIAIVIFLTDHIISEWRKDKINCGV